MINHLETERINLVKILEDCRPFDLHEQISVERFLSFLSHTPEPFSRSTQEGHLTASAIVFHRERWRILLVWHRKLGKWLQPGGHVEPDEDRSLLNAALRELEEETGVPENAVRLLEPAPFDLDVHTIPAQDDVPEHYHYDVRFLFGCNCEADDPDKLGIRWQELNGATDDLDLSLQRIEKKLEINFPR